MGYGIYEIASCAVVCIRRCSESSGGSSQVPKSEVLQWCEGWVLLSVKVAQEHLEVPTVVMRLLKMQSVIATPVPCSNTLATSM